MRADMLVGLYFPTVEPWLRSLELLGDQLEESVRSHPNESENAGQLSRDESAIQYTREAIVEYGAMRLTLLQLLNDELDKLK